MFGKILSSPLKPVTTCGKLHLRCLIGFGFAIIIIMLNNKSYNLCFLTMCFYRLWWIIECISNPYKPNLINVFTSSNCPFTACQACTWILQRSAPAVASGSIDHYHTGRGRHFGSYSVSSHTFPSTFTCILLKNIFRQAFFSF